MTTSTMLRFSLLLSISALNGAPLSIPTSRSLLRAQAATARDSCGASGCLMKQYLLQTVNAFTHSLLAALLVKSVHLRYVQSLVHSLKICPPPPPSRFTLKTSGAATEQDSFKAALTKVKAIIAGCSAAYASVVTVLPEYTSLLL